MGGYTVVYSRSNGLLKVSVGGKTKAFQTFSELNRYISALEPDNERYHQLYFYADTYFNYCNRIIEMVNDGLDDELVEFYINWVDIYEDMIEPDEYQHMMEILVNRLNN